MSDYEDSEDLHDVIRRLSAWAAVEEQVSSEAVETAKMAFDLRQVEDELAELVHTDGLAVRGDAAEPTSELRFRVQGLDILVSLRRGQLAVVVAPPPDGLDVESAGGRQPVELDDVGGATIAALGVVRLRVRRNGNPDVVTDPFVVPGTD